MRRLILPLVALSALVFSAATASAQTGSQVATAELMNPDGQTVGTATLTETDAGVDVQVEVMNLEPGTHGIHLHQVGACEPPDFSSAGDHFNPRNREHGLENPAGPHAGDLPNIEIRDDGTGSLSYVNERIAISQGDGAVLDGDGTALVVHENPDDQMTDPGGESGDRAACGVVTQADQVAPATGSPGSLDSLGLGLAQTAIAGIGLMVLASGLVLRVRRNAV